MTLRSLFVLLAAVSLVLGCESRGFTPDCPAMPITDQGPNAPELVAWREEAVALGCATAAAGTNDGEGGQGGSAGASGN